MVVADPAGGVFTTSGTPERAWDLWSSVSDGRAGPGSSVAAVPIGGDQCALFVADPLGGVFTTSGDSSTLIKHVFVLMLENRSFDHMLGFSGIEGTDASTGQRTRIEGLIGIDGRIGLEFKNVFVSPGHHMPVSNDATDVIAPVQVIPRRPRAAVRCGRRTRKAILPSSTADDQDFNQRPVVAREDWGS